MEFAQTVLDILEEEEARFQSFTIGRCQSRKNGILAPEIYGANGFSILMTERSIRDLTRLGYDKLPICTTGTAFHIR